MTAKPKHDPACPHEVDGIHVLPVLHERLEYADGTRETIARLRPDAIAVEIPSSLQEVWTRALQRLPAISVVLFENADGRTIYLPVHPADPMVEAARSALDAGLPLRCADLDVDGYADYRDRAPDPHCVTRLGLSRVYSVFREIPRAVDPRDAVREASLAYHAVRLREEGAARVLLVCGMHHAERVAGLLGGPVATPLTPPRRRNVRTVHLHPESLSEVLSEIPYHVAAYECRRNGIPPEPPPPKPAATPAAPIVGRPFRLLPGARRDDASRDREAIARAARAASDPIEERHGAGRTREAGAIDRLRLQSSLLREAEKRLVARMPDEEVHSWQRRNLARFSRSLALHSGLLVPDLYDLLVAARGCVSENFAWETLQVASLYPAQADRATDLPTARIRADEIHDGVRKVHIRPLHRRPKRPDWRRIVRGRPTEPKPGDWTTNFDRTDICSYPPEDLVIEEFGRYLRRRGKSVLSEEQARTVPFTTSVLDGIDIRETIRHWTERKLFVRELGRAPGEVGSVAVIFDEDEQRYPYRQTWIGEHDQESDMAFFSTDPADGVVGPGISRVTYGGFLMSYPPRRMADVWTDPDYGAAETPAEVLLLAGLDYCAESIFVHVAPRPPRSILRQLAGRLGLKLLHLPLGTLSPTTLRRLRVMHILAGHEKRANAGDYIW